MKKANVYPGFIVFIARYGFIKIMLQFDVFLQNRDKELSEEIVQSFWSDENPEHQAFWTVYDAESLLQDIQEKIKNFPFKRLIVLGMGASLLDSKAVIEAGKIDTDKVAFISSLDESALDKATKNCAPGDCGFLIISKSGRTLETVAFALAARKWILSKGLSLSKHLVFVCGEGDSPLTRMTQEDRLEFTFLHPNIGGRFAIFTVVTLVVGIFAGLDMKAFAEGGRACLEGVRSHPMKSSVAQSLSFYLSAKEEGRRLSILESFDPSYAAFGEWWKQMWSESLGKEDHPILPILSSGPLDHHSQWQLYLSAPKDKCFTFIAPPVGDGAYLADTVLAETLGVSHFSKLKMSDVSDATFHGAKSVLMKVGTPYAVWNLNQESAMHALGYVMMHTLPTIIFVGRMTGIDPFGQPAVEALKVGAREFIAKKES